MSTEEESASICKHSGVIYSSRLKPENVSEQFTTVHGLCYIFSGTLIVSQANKNQHFNKGDLIFFKKNSLAKFRKQPDRFENFRSITVVFDSKVLKEFNIQKDSKWDPTTKKSEALTRISGDLGRLHAYFEGLSKYFEKPLSQDLMDLKIKEALLLLIQIAPGLKPTLFEFGQPGKIDIEEFMHQNFRFNVEMARLAFLSGRSLASFKRDFQKTFRTTPSRWLHRRRLEEAHFQLKEHKRRPSEIYHEVGFETISHFSHSFKQHFGVNPSTL